MHTQHETDFEEPFDVQDRLRAWSPLAGTERNLVSRQIEHSQIQLDTLEEQIQTLQEQKRVLVDRLSKHRSLLAPIRSLPLELLSEILSLVSRTTIHYYEEEKEYTCDLCANFNRDTGWRDILAINVPAATFSNVCTTWNALCNSVNVDIN